MQIFTENKKLLRFGLLVIFFFTSLIGRSTISGQAGKALPLGIWTSSQDLATIAMDGPAWEAVLGGAQRDISNPDLADQDDHTGEYALAKAIVFARTGEGRYRDEVIESIESLVAKGHPGGRTLAWARNISGFVLAADLIGYRTSTFEDYLRHLAFDWKGSQLNRSLHEVMVYMPNNWGKFAMQSLTATYWYLQDFENLQLVRDHFIRWVVGPELPENKVSRTATDWYSDQGNRLQINPMGASKTCSTMPGGNDQVQVVIDGLQPSEMRRSGECALEPAYTGYGWEGLQPLVGTARMMERAGMSIWELGDRAIYRAANALQIRLGGSNSKWKATSRNDGWLLIFLDTAYGTDWSLSLDSEPSIKYGAGRGAGWGYVLAADPISPPFPDPTFADVPVDHWAHHEIELLYEQGYIAGCRTDPLLYCPDAAMSRAESAVFVERGVHGAGYLAPDPLTKVFDDVALSEWFAKWAVGLWEDGYTAGCGTDPLIYCPVQEHTRTEGTVFFLRMLHGPSYVPPDPTGLFADVNAGYWGAKWIEAAYNARLIPACENSPDLLFCPDDPLDRAMAAYMMVQAKGLDVP